ncbi:MAG: DNA polymerase III subunit epsilon [Gammaproteobacteria bacterium]|nr:DNA polymerase III subunit epsilon [Gammaproteobacteria bacterium]MCW5584216.1 DNA polymerase III subunit epsilon [Gammaproteobacteria bacterium]
MRQVILDTETTGIRVDEGHRVIEIGCIEMINRKLTGKHFHQYINPEREVEAGALAVHGITNEFLLDKPQFSKIAKSFMDFISGSELIIHNAPFDLSFLNNEFLLLDQHWKSITNYCNVVDTLQIARQLHAGQRNSLDALCKRYGIDNSKRDLHGALLDAHLLAQVYLAMTGGQGSFFDAISETQHGVIKNAKTSSNTSIQKYSLLVLRATVDELDQHENYLALLKKQGKCIWGN